MPRIANCNSGQVLWAALSIFGSDSIRTEALDSCFDAFSSRKPVSTSLENALMQPQLSRFPAQHRLFTRDAPVIAGQGAAFAERTVARYDERHRISSDRGAHGARRLGVLDAGRDVGIADRATHRNL